MPDEWQDAIQDGVILLGSFYGLYLVFFRWSKLRIHSRTLDYYFYWQIFFWSIVWLLSIFAIVVAGSLWPES